MKLIIFTTLLFLSTLAYGEVVNKPLLPTPLNRPDTIEMSIQGYVSFITPYTYDIQKIEVVKYDIQRFDDLLRYISDITPEKLDIIRYIIADLSPEKIQILRYELDRLDVTKFDTSQWVIYITTYDAVTNYGKELMSAVKSVKVSHWIKVIMEELKKAVPDLAVIEYAKAQLRAELAGIIPTTNIEALVGYMEGTVKPIRQPIEWALWKDAYDITQEIPHGDIFLLIKELSIGYEKLYDVYFSNHQGKTMVVFSWDIARENYIRQFMYQFIERYENKIYAVMPNYGVFNNIDDKGDYTKWVEPIGQVIVWVKSNTNLPVGLTVCQVRDDSDARFHEAMKDLKYDFVYLWGLHDFNYDFGIEFGEANRWANGRPVILGGFFGNRENPTGLLPDAILTDISYKLPSFIAQRKSEGWVGLHIIGDRWNTILSKCKERGITF